MVWFLALPFGWLAAVNLVFAAAVWALGAVSLSGAMVGAAYGLVIAAGLGGPGYLLLAWFVALGSVWSRLGLVRKRELAVAQENRGRRTWRHATANVAVAAAMAGLAKLTGSAGWTWAFVASLAAALADTTESELGVLVAGVTWDPIRRRRVPAGTEGAVSLGGTLLGALAAAATTGLAMGLGLVPVTALWPLAAVALSATVIESLVGSRWELSNELLNGLTTGCGAGLGWLVWRCVTGW